MQREDAQVGMKVYFGRRNGEQTLGIIRKVNPSKANIECLEVRGQVRQTGVGAIWHVPYSMMRPAAEDAVANAAVKPLPVPVQRPKLEFNQFQSDVERYILLAIVSVYGHLSPENLTCDGELPMYRVRQRQAELNRQLRGLQSALGREVDESEAYDWYDGYTEYQKNQEEARAARVAAMGTK